MKEFKYNLSTLALGAKYSEMARNLALSLEKQNPSKRLWVATDCPECFARQSNVAVTLHTRRGLWHCYHDKRFVARAALQQDEATLYVDADTTIVKPLPDTIVANPGLTSVFCKSFEDQIKNYLPSGERTKLLRVVEYLDLTPSDLILPMDYTWLITRDQGRERDFLSNWGLVACSLDYAGANITDAYVMAIACGLSGWKPNPERLDHIVEVLDHQLVTTSKPPNRLRNRLHRLNKALFLIRRILS